MSAQSEAAKKVYDELREMGADLCGGHGMIRLEMAFAAVIMAEREACALAADLSPGARETAVRLRTDGEASAYAVLGQIDRIQAAIRARGAA